MFCLFIDDVPGLLFRLRCVRCICTRCTSLETETMENILLFPQIIFRSETLRTEAANDVVLFVAGIVGFCTCIGQSNSDHIGIQLSQFLGNITKLILAFCVRYTPGG